MVKNEDDSVPNTLNVTSEKYRREHYKTKQIATMCQSRSMTAQRGRQIMFEGQSLTSWSITKPFAWN